MDFGLYVRSFGFDDIIHVRYVEEVIIGYTDIYGEAQHVNGHFIFGN